MFTGHLPASASQVPAFQTVATMAGFEECDLKVTYVPTTRAAEHLRVSLHSDRPAMPFDSCGKLVGRTRALPGSPSAPALPGPSHPCSAHSSQDLFVPFAEHSKLIHVFVKGTGCSQSGGQRAGFLSTHYLLATSLLPSVEGSSKISSLVTSPLGGSVTHLCIPLMLR